MGKAYSYGSAGCWFQVQIHTDRALNPEEANARLTEARLAVLASAPQFTSFDYRA